MVLVVTPDIASLSNAFKTKLIAERLNVEPLGVVVTRITGKDFEIPTEKINSTMELPVLASIPEDPAVRRSVALGEPVVIHNPKSKAAKEMKKLAEKLVNLSSTC